MLVNTMLRGTHPQFRLTVQRVPSIADEDDAKGQPAVAGPKSAVGKKPTIGKMLVDFLYFFGDQFAWRKTGISIRNGGMYFQLNRPVACMWIEDPFRPGVNVAANTFQVMKVKGAFREGFISLVQYFHHQKSSAMNPTLLSTLIRSSPWLEQFRLMSNAKESEIVEKEMPHLRRDANDALKQAKPRDASLRGSTAERAESPRKSAALSTIRKKTERGRRKSLVKSASRQRRRRDCVTRGALREGGTAKVAKSQKVERRRIIERRAENQGMARTEVQRKVKRNRPGLIIFLAISLPWEVTV